MHVKPGDQVVLYRGSVSLPELAIVKRVTPTGQVLLIDYPSRFHKDGRVIGGGHFSSEFLLEATPENIAKMKQEQQRRRTYNYAQQVRTTLQMYIQKLDVTQIETLLQQLGVPLPDKLA